MTESRVDIRSLLGGTVVRIHLNAPKANILDTHMYADLVHAFKGVRQRRGLRALVLGAEGPHFSFGASIEEHLPDRIETSLRQLREVLDAITAVHAPTIAAVRGRCLGGGFELALACDLLMAEADAELGCPEIKLGVFAPAASVLLPLRVGDGHACDLLLTGRSVKGADAAQSGLVNRVAEPGRLDEALHDWLQQDFLVRSPAGLRHAALIARRARRRAVREDLPAVELHYLQELLEEPDANEGIRAFLEKRAPHWQEEPEP
jgi:cyclohexa-1,5-dienecarbonyl-CoA hydratase